MGQICGKSRYSHHTRCFVSLGPISGCQTSLLFIIGQSSARRLDFIETAFLIRVEYFLESTNFPVLFSPRMQNGNLNISMMKRCEENDTWMRNNGQVGRNGKEYHEKLWKGLESTGRISIRIKKTWKYYERERCAIGHLKILRGSGLFLLRSVQLNANSTVFFWSIDPLYPCYLSSLATWILSIRISIAKSVWCLWKSDLYIILFLAFLNRLLPDIQSLSSDRAAMQ